MSCPSSSKKKKTKKHSSLYTVSIDIFSKEKKKIFFNIFPTFIKIITISRRKYNHSWSHDKLKTLTEQ